jgi:hypothetical protein
MKYIEVPSLDEIGLALTDRELGIVTVNGGIHLYAFPGNKGRFHVKAERENSNATNASTSSSRSSSLGSDSRSKILKAAIKSEKTVTPTPGQWANATFSAEKPKNNNTVEAPHSPITVFAGVAGAVKGEERSTIVQPKIAVAIKNKRRQGTTDFNNGIGSADGSNNQGNMPLKLAVIQKPTNPRSRSNSSTHSRTASLGSYTSGDDFPIVRGRIRSTSIGGSTNDMISGVLTSEGRQGKGRSMSLGDWTNQHSAHRILMELTSTLNESFPDYDFSQAKVTSFVVDKVENVIRTVNNYFSDLQSEENPHFLENLWAAVDTEVKLSQCEVYSYVPDMDGDPFSEGSIWSFNYFFIDRDAKKIAYFTCVACASMHRANLSLENNVYYPSDTEVGDHASPPSQSPSHDPYGVYGSPRVTSDVTGSDVDDDDQRKANIAMQQNDDSDDSCDEMI